MVKSGTIEEAYNHFYVIRNISHVLISLISLGILVKIPFAIYEKYSKFFFFLTIILLVVVLLI
jgi:cell division protein FtsW (lipid II flippase)